MQLKLKINKDRIADRALAQADDVYRI